MDDPLREEHHTRPAGTRWTAIARNPAQIAGVVFGLAIVFEALVGLSPAPDGRWAARAAAWNAILLFANLIVLWWYAKRTEDIHRLAQRIRQETNKPIVVATANADPRNPGDVTYWLENIGPGVATNVWTATWESGGVRLESGGALKAGGQRRPPSSAEELLRERRPKDTRRVVLVLAEGIGTRTAPWVVTSNRRNHVNGPGAEIESVLLDLGNAPYGCATAADLVRRLWPQFAAELGANPGVTPEVSSSRP